MAKAIVTVLLAFTATPKARTLEVFGQKGIDGKPEPFHLYSMRQAIEEGFILDVLQTYTTYQVFFQLSKKIEGRLLETVAWEFSPTLSHGNLHPSNVIVDSLRKINIIDWETATGNKTPEIVCLKRKGLLVDVFP